MTPLLVPRLPKYAGETVQKGANDVDDNMGNKFNTFLKKKIQCTLLSVSV